MSRAADVQQVLNETEQLQVGCRHLSRPSLLLSLEPFPKLVADRVALRAEERHVLGGWRSDESQRTPAIREPSHASSHRLDLRRVSYRLFILIFTSPRSTASVASLPSSNMKVMAHGMVYYAQGS